MIYRKADILIRREQGRTFPCVNVKVRGGGYDLDRRIDALIAKGGAEFAVPGFDSAWIRSHLTEAQQSAWWDTTIGDAWQDLQNAAEAIWPGRTVYSAGRSGGYAYIGGFTAADVESWDAIALTRWRRFARVCADLVADLPCRCAWAIWSNVYEPAQEEAREEARAAQEAESWRLAVFAAHV